MKTIKLKTLPQYFQAVKDETKNFEIRNNDREYEVGDVLVLAEYDLNTNTFTGEQLTREVTYITDYAQQAGMVVLGLRKVMVA